MAGLRVRPRQHADGVIQVLDKAVNLEPLQPGTLMGETGGAGSAQVAGSDRSALDGNPGLGIPNFLRSESVQLRFGGPPFEANRGVLLLWQVEDDLLPRARVNLA